MIAVPIVASTTKEALKDMKKALRIADLVELRLDFIGDIDIGGLSRLLSGGSRKVIVTDRKNRLGLVREAVRLGVGFVDLDISIGEKTIKGIIKNKNKTKIIVSFHNFKKTSKKEILKRYGVIKRLDPDVIKVATYANSITDNIVAFDVIKKARKENREVIALCMGEKGEISRILSPLFGGFLTFASLAGKGSVPGQIDVKLLKDVYRVDKLRKPKIFGLVGNPVKHSKGVIIHNNSFRKLRLNNIYVNFLADDLKLFVRDFGPIVSGLSVTIPFKKDIMKYLDKVDDSVNGIGAVNTVVKRNGKLIGYNTDLSGAMAPIESKIKIKGKRVLMIGAGGVARAIGYGVVQKKGKLTILNRTKRKAKRLAKELKCNGAGLDQLDKLSNVDLIINATSIGMFPNVNRTPVEKKTLKKIICKGAVVFDSVYNPRKTKLLKDAKRLRCRVVDGYDMFINQAKEQFKLFTRRELK